ncbi:hypothetical protein HLG73_08310 [Lacticaseibacillus paracasei]|uniref:hypothetical protein n=1 Tax=Lacticaseibacillus paracasei TaxID=1597 RepID=UPI0008DDFCC6|nr:hypothetical protein [Lacticaseibacillus paracasei]OHY49226.1 hypothetical protein BBX46_11775 [Lacticaseibacillus paracasei]QPC20673.1 hypothetical protein LacP0625_08410 [Lacticaseibacillus paracasei subsp. tolerans]WCZ19344.1 hypothetical protein HLG73_08310 [Lacticaseibacillus paracasei]
MLKKMVIFGLLALTMAGCGSPSANDKPKSTSSVEIASKYYHQLDKKEQSMVFFTFKAVADDSQDGGKYIVDMKVRNGTKSQLKFDLSKFILSTSNTGTPIKSVKHGDLTIAPMRTKTVTGLFDSATAANFNGVGEFCYLSRDFLLAYSYGADKAAGATTDNLKVASLIAQNKAATQKPSASAVSTQSQAATSAPASEASQQVSQASTQPTQQSQASSAPVHVVNSAEQAMQIAAPFLNTTASALRATPVDDGWQVGPKMTYADVIVHYNGRVFSPANPATGQPDHWLN